MAAFPVPLPPWYRGLEWRLSPRSTAFLAAFAFFQSCSANNRSNASSGVTYFFFFALDLAMCCATLATVLAADGSGSNGGGIDGSWSGMDSSGYSGGTL